MDPELLRCLLKSFQPPAGQRPEAPDPGEYLLIRGYRIPWDAPHLSVEAPQREQQQHG